MRKNKLLIPIIIIIIITILCSTFSGCLTEKAINILVNTESWVPWYFLCLIFMVYQGRFVPDQDRYTLSYEDISINKDSYKELEKDNNTKPNTFGVVGTNDNYKPANTNTNKEGNPNKTISEIGGREKPKVDSITLHGYLTGLEAHQLTITIYFTTGAIEGSFYHSAEGNCWINEIDKNGNKIPGAKKIVFGRYEISGKITGWLNLTTYAVTGDMTCKGSVVYDGKVYPVDEPGKVSGTLDKNNSLSCTVDNGYNIKASP